MIKAQATSVLKKIRKKTAQPKQERTQKRMQMVIQTTQELLLAVGIERISIPEIANAVGIPRTSIYQFFPTKYDLLRHIALMHLNVLVTRIGHAAVAVLSEHPKASIDEYGQKLSASMIQTTAHFFNESEVASLIILSGPFTRQAYLEYQVELKKVSVGVRKALEMIKVDHYVPQQPDSLTILMELVFTCMKHGYYNENYISEKIIQESYRIAMSYLAALKDNAYLLAVDEG
ncbi:TetR/AcrR family transcriptional regulator [Acinetobacter sichuanensis]|uniref:TetR/AcrR family transcriptional regulator n=1 Tax=Acinetobacter sichuanensis TaxID=2136183 RepID=A0A371YUZ9_9GAMM|nr:MULTISPECIES: TetR/AcrR family transcriptional regulator [Acinetobacter]MDM1246030.1 TetR family transcriptional regulator [Acinetobacter sp. R933-2]MDQ9020589.1 TetR/AcrR family transcriptional regulator [Acinetobacter sichuanensis]RFC85301.1 TetR/AcrR family transcriptional regulator [Acinetobacter sichuanensis]